MFASGWPKFRLLMLDAPRIESRNFDSISRFTCSGKQVCDGLDAKRLEEDGLEIHAYTNHMLNHTFEKMACA